MSSSISIKKGLKQGDALSPLVFNDTHQVLHCVDNVNLISDGITTERSADVLMNACEDIGLAVNVGKTSNQISQNTCSA